MLSNNQQAFFALVRAGLWEQEVRLSQYVEINYSAVMRLAEKQSVIGLITAGIGQVVDEKVPAEEVLQFVGASLQIEQQNQVMNRLTESLIKKLRNANINCLLVKGQGIAQCYEKPLWRSSGDIDLFFSKKDYQKGVDFLTPFASEKLQDAKYTKSYGLIINDWMVELHGTLRNTLSSKMDRMIDAVQEDEFNSGDVRVWRCGNTDIFMPNADNDLFLLFTHFVRHFYKGGISFRQLCDWCRLLCKYRSEINILLLESRLRKAGLTDEWKAFAAVTVDFLGMPVEAMPLYDNRKKWHKKANKIIGFIFNTKPINSIGDKLARVKVFPANTLFFLPAMLFHLNWLKIKERLVR